MAFLHTAAAAATPRKPGIYAVARHRAAVWQPAAAAVSAAVVDGDAPALFCRRARALRKSKAARVTGAGAPSSQRVAALAALLLFESRAEMPP